MTESEHTTKQAFLMVADAMRAMNSTQQTTNRLLETVVEQLRSINRKDEEIVQQMKAVNESHKDLSKRQGVSEGKIKLLERAKEEHDRQLATLRGNSLSPSASDRRTADR
jgi:replicative DNA helicase